MADSEKTIEEEEASRGLMSDSDEKLQTDGSKLTIPPVRYPDITADLPQQDSERGTEKLEGGKSPVVKNNKSWGVKWFRDVEDSPYQDNLKVPDDNPNESLVQDVSSTAVLTPLDDDLVGNVPVDRGNWTGRFDFLMSLLGYSVGLGNVWRFPYLAYRNGGGAFLFPFILMLILLGIPLMFLELAFGQFAALGPAAIYDRFCPLFHGLGYGMVIVSAMVSLYYTMIIGWCFFYLFASFTAVLPWEKCDPEWRSATCYPFNEADICNKINGSIYYNLACWNATAAADNNITQELAHNATKTPPAEDYFNKYVLDKSEGIEDIGAPRWQLALCLFLAWGLTFGALSKGVKSTGKVVYFTALFPYVVLTILFFRGVTLDGAVDGIIYYVTPQFHKLGEASVWGDAAVQIFFALSPAWGGLITLASYNKFHNNCFKDALIVSIGNICTSIFAGLVIFGIIGYLAHELDMPVDQVVKQGAGLAFIVYPDVVSRLPISPLWSILFFVMMITLGMGSEFALLETVITAVQDTYPNLRKRKTWVVLGVCICGFLGGLIITTRGGMYILSMMDAYAASYSVFFIAISECILVAWVYKAERFLQDIELMIGQQSRLWHRYFTIFWKYLSPLTLIFVMVFNWIQYKPLQEDDYFYPPAANAVGWLLAIAPIAFVVGMGVYKVTQAPENMSIKERLVFLMKPSVEWGPAHKIPSLDPDRNGHSHEKEDKTIENPNFNFNTRV